MKSLFLKTTFIAAITGSVLAMTNVNAAQYKLFMGEERDVYDIDVAIQRATSLAEMKASSEGYGNCKFYNSTIGPTIPLSSRSNVYVTLRCEK